MVFYKHPWQVASSSMLSTILKITWPSPWEEQCWYDCFLILLNESLKAGHFGHYDNHRGPITTGRSSQITTLSEQQAQREWGNDPMTLWEASRWSESCVHQGMTSGDRAETWDRSKEGSYRLTNQRHTQWDYLQANLHRGIKNVFVGRLPRLQPQDEEIADCYQ